VDLSGLQLSEGARRNVPHWLGLFPASQRQHMGSADMKDWAKLAIAERKARMGTEIDSSSMSGTASALSAAKALMGGSSVLASHDKELLESDFLFALLAMQARREHGLGAAQGASGSGSGYKMGVARLSGALPVPSDVGATSSGGSSSGPSNDFALLNLLGDMAEMGEWRLGPGWEAAVRYMLDEQHMAPARRQEFNTSTRLKHWLREAAKDRQRMKSMHQGAGGSSGIDSGSGIGSGASAADSNAGINGGEISALNLAHALIASQHAHSQ